MTSSFFFAGVIIQQGQRDHRRLTPWYVQHMLMNAGRFYARGGQCAYDGNP